MLLTELNRCVSENLQLIHSVCTPEIDQDSSIQNCCSVNKSYILFRRESRLLCSVGSMKQARDTDKCIICYLHKSNPLKFPCYMCTRPSVHLAEKNVNISNTNNKKHLISWCSIVFWKCSSIFSNTDLFIIMLIR